MLVNMALTRFPIAQIGDWKSRQFKKSWNEFSSKKSPQLFENSLTAERSE